MTFLTDLTDAESLGLAIIAIVSVALIACAVRTLCKWHREDRENAEREASSRKSKIVYPYKPGDWSDRRTISFGDSRRGRVFPARGMQRGKASRSSVPSSSGAGDALDFVTQMNMMNAITDSSSVPSCDSTPPCDLSSPCDTSPSCGCDPQ